MQIINLLRDYDRERISYSELKTILYTDFEKKELKCTLKVLKKRYEKVKRKEEERLNKLLTEIEEKKELNDAILKKISTIFDGSRDIKSLCSTLEDLINNYKKILSIPARPVKNELWVSPVNVFNHKGNRCRKARCLYRNKTYTVVEEFFSVGLATHGPACKVKDENSYIYLVSREDVEYLEEE